MDHEDVQLEREGSPQGAASAPRRRGVRIRTVNAIAIVVSAVVALFALLAVDHVFESERISEQADLAYRACSSAARDLQEASDYLTSNVRVYVVTGNRVYMDAYLEELQQTDRRGKAVDTLKSHFGEDSDAVQDLESALGFSNALAERELYAMKLVALATELPDVPPLVAEVDLDAADEALDATAQRALAERIVLGEEYQETKTQISDSVKSCSNVMIEALNASVDAGNSQMRQNLTRMQAAIILLLIVIVVIIFAVIFLVLWPLSVFTHEVQRSEPLALMGSSEMRYMSEAYNVIYAENRERTAHLQHAAERDSLTGLYNRGAYDQLLLEHTHDMALLLIDVDYFKTVNDSYGHDVGDAVLKKVALLLTHSFRASDLPCRIGGDEFAVIMTDMHPELRHVVSGKLEALAKALHDTSDGLPDVTLSIGIAFSEAHPGEDDLFKAADHALYVVKERGRNGYAYYDEVQGEVAHAL